MMRIVFLICWLVFIAMAAFSQVVDYTVPNGFKTEISAVDYKTIVDASVAAISKRYKVDSVQDGTVKLVKLQDMQAFHLHNLIVECLKEKNKTMWEITVREHFDKLFSTIDEQEKFDPEDFKEAKKYLSIRVYPKEFVMQRPNSRSFIVQTNLEGTFTMLMYDLPGGAFTPVQRKTFVHWNRDIDAIYAIAKSNINKQQVQKISQAVDADGVKIDATLLSNENYAGSYAICIGDNSPELVGELGCIVAIPHKGAAYVYKIVKGKPGNLISYIQKTKPVVDGAYAEHPQPISNQFFWYYKDKFIKVPVTSDKDGKVNVTLPNSLTALLAKSK